MKRYILTGAPGAGKTTLIHALAASQYTIIEEAATDAITLAQSQGVAAPWTHPSFIETILQLQVYRQTQSAHLPSSLQFFDRSPLCTYALCKFLNYPLPDTLMIELSRIKTEATYENAVFFIENLGFIQPSAARRINFEDALRFEALHKTVYEDFGYTLISIPNLPLDQRLHMILNTVQHKPQH